MGLGSSSALDSIVHDGLHAALPKVYPTLVEIQAATYTQRPNGERVETWVTVVVAYGNLAKAARNDLEVRTGEMTQVPLGWKLNLAGHYPQISIEHRAYINGEFWNISAVVHDSLGASTRLDLERTEH